MLRNDIVVNDMSEKKYMFRGEWLGVRAIAKILGRGDSEVYKQLAAGDPPTECPDFGAFRAKIPPDERSNTRKGKAKLERRRLASLDRSEKEFKPNPLAGFGYISGSN